MDSADQPARTVIVDGVRKNGKHWHERKTPFRLQAGQMSWSKRLEERKAQKAMKDKEREMKAEKEEERQKRIQGIKDRRAAKAEKEHFAKVAEKVHGRRLERLRRKQKRNKLLNS